MKSITLIAVAFALLMYTTPSISQNDDNPLSRFMQMRDRVKAEIGKQIGTKEHASLQKELGGTYNDPELLTYLNGIVQRLVAKSPMAGQPFRITIMDNPDLNAFALPGGYLYITRGLLGFLNDEAELAFVLGHEVAHVTGHDGVEKMGHAMLANFGANLLANRAMQRLGSRTAGVFVAEAAGGFGKVRVASFSRSQEAEADANGSIYFTRLGYPKAAAASALNVLQEGAQLQFTIRDRKYVERASLLSTHPAIRERIRDMGGDHYDATRSPLRQRYMQQIDGMPFGDNPDKGLVRNQQFLHAKLRFGFDLPDGYVVDNQDDAVMMKPKNAGGGAAIFTFVPTKRGDAKSVAREVGGVDGSNLRTISVGGLPAATVVVREVENGKRTQTRYVFIDSGGSHIPAFALITGDRPARGVTEDFLRMVLSYRRLSRDETAAIRQARLRAYRVRAGDTVASLSARMDVPSHAQEQFLAMNGLEPGARLTPGMIVKLVMP